LVLLILRKKPLRVSGITMVWYARKTSPEYCVGYMPGPGSLSYSYTIYDGNNSILNVIFRIFLYDD
jgi:hypothetical protein